MYGLVLALSERRHCDGHGLIIGWVQLHGQDAPIGGRGAGDSHAPLGRDGIDVSVNGQKVRVVPVVGEVLNDDAARNLRKLIHASQPNGLSGLNTAKDIVMFSYCSLKPKTTSRVDRS